MYESMENEHMGHVSMGSECMGTCNHTYVHLQPVKVITNSQKFSPVMVSECFLLPRITGQVCRGRDSQAGPEWGTGHQFQNQSVQFNQFPSAGQVSAGWGWRQPDPGQSWFHDFILHTSIQTFIPCAPIH